MPEKVIFLGNDLHGPQLEMGAKLVAELREVTGRKQSFAISIQSRKEKSGESFEILEGSPGWISRVRQLYRLRKRLLESVSEGDILHFVGNGNKILFSVIASVATRKRALLVISLLGETASASDITSATIVTVHEAVRDALGSAAAAVKSVRPWSLLPQGAARSTMSGRIAFASVPPKPEELTERGVASLIRTMAEVRRRLPQARLVILNRYPHMEESLQRLANEAPPGAVELRTGYVDNLAEFYDSVDVVLAPSEKAHLPQIPMSVLDGCARGCAAIVSSSLAIAEEIDSYRAGASISDIAQLPDALVKIAADYAAASNGALRLNAERFGRDRGLAEYAALYATLGRREG